MKYVFIPGMPKSGTTLVASLLDRLSSVTGKHEWIGTAPDELRLPFLQLSWYVGRGFAVPYLERVKRHIEANYATEYFSDVGANLQRSVPFLEEAFDPVAVLHLVRDPRDQVRSHYTHRSDDTHLRLPLLPGSDADVERWIDGDKFTHICLQWAETTRLLVDQGAHLIRLEQIVSDYDYCRRELFDRCGLEVSEDLWRDHVSSRVNAMPSRPYRFVRAKVKGKGYVAERLPPFEEWEPERQQTLLDICGESMELVGYDPSGPRGEIRHSVALRQS
jgi:hypothetical protein